MTKISNVGALIGCPRCKQTLRKPESYAKRHVLTPYKLGCCYGRVRHHGQRMSTKCVLDNQMWPGCVKMCSYVMVSTLKVVILTYRIPDTELCQTCKEAARCHSASPRHPTMSQGMASPQMLHRCFRMCKMPSNVDRRAQIFTDVPAPLQTSLGVRGQMLQMLAGQHAPFSECTFMSGQASQAHGSLAARVCTRTCLPQGFHRHTCMAMMATSMHVTAQSQLASCGTLHTPVLSGPAALGFDRIHRHIPIRG